MSDVRVQGATVDEIRSALQLAHQLDTILAKAASRRGLEQRRRYSDLQALLTSHGSVLPEASVAQAQRGAERRLALLGSGVVSLAELQRLRGDELASSTRTWLTRQRAQHALFSVTHQRRALVPAFLLDDVVVPRPELRPLIVELDAAGLGSWQKWVWLTSGSSALSGRTPERVARDEPRLALEAVQRFTSRW